MIGIILKDFYESFCIRKNLIGFIFSYLSLALVVFGIKNQYVLILIIILAY